MAEVISTYGAAPATYPDLLTAVNATNAMASVTTKHILEGKDQVHTVAGGLVRPNSSDVSSAYHRVIRQVGGAPRASLQRQQSGARHNLRLLPLGDSWLEVRDIEVFGVSDGFCNTGNGSNQLWERSLIHGNRDTIGPGNPASCCASDRGTGSNNTFRNLALYDNTVGFWSGGNTGNLVKAQNITVLNCTWGVYWQRVMTAELKNFLVGGSVTADFLLAAGSWPTRSNNQSSDATGDAGHQNKPIANEVTSATRYSEDATLIAGAFALGSAEDLSGEFADDYFQSARPSGLWDKGADQLSAFVLPDQVVQLSMPAETQELLEMGAQYGWALEMIAQTHYDLDMEG